MVSFEIPVTSSGEDPESNNKENEKKKGKSHSKCKKHKHRETEVNTGDSMAAHEIPVTADGEEPGSSNEESKTRCTNKGISHMKRKKHKHKEIEVNTEDSVVSYETPVTANREEPESSKEGNKSLCAKKGGSHLKRKKHKHKEDKSNTGESIASCEMTVTSNGEDPESNNKENERKKDKSHSKWKKHKHRETEVNTGDSVVSCEMPVTSSGEDPEGNNKENEKKKGKSHLKRKRHKHKETEVNIGDRMAAHEIPVTANGEEPESSNDENQNLCTKKDSSHPKQEKKKYKETKVNTGNSILSYEIPVTSNEEQTGNNNEESKNLCAKRGNLHLKQKKQKHGETGASIGDSMESHKVLVIVDGEEPESSNDENKNMRTKKDSLHQKRKKKKHKDTEVITGHSRISYKILATVDGEAPESSNEENKNLCTKKDSSKLKQKKNKHKENKVNTGNNMVFYEIPVSANGEEEKGSNEENKNVCIEKHSSHAKLKKHKPKETEVNIGGSMASRQIPVTASGEEPESSNEENKNVHTKKHSSQLKQKKNKYKEGKINIGNSMVSYEIPMSANREEAESSSEERKNLCSKKDSSHPEWKKHKHKETEANIGDRMSSHKIPLTADGGGPENSNEENNNLCTKKDSSHPEWKKNKHRDTEVNTIDSIVSYEVPVTSNGDKIENGNEESKNVCTKRDSSHLKWKKHKHKETGVNIGDSMVSHEIPVTADGRESESSNEKNKSLCTKKDSSHLKRKKNKHKENKVNTGNNMVLYEIPVSAKGEEEKGSNEENKNVCIEKHSSHAKLKKHKPKETEVNIGGSMASRQIPVTASGEEPESSNEENKNVHTKKHSSQLKQKKNKCKEGKINTGNSMVSYEIPMSKNREEAESSNEERKNLCSKKDSSHPEWKKHKHKETEANIGDRMSSHKIPLTADGGGPENSNEENNNLCTKKDSSHPEWKKNKHRDTEVNIIDSIVSYEVPVTSNGDKIENGNEESKNVCTMRDSSHLKWKKHKHKETGVNIGDSMVSHEIPVTADGRESESSNEKNKSLCTKKDSSHLKRKKNKHKDTEVNTVDSTASHVMSVTSTGKEPESSNKGSKNLCTTKDSSHPKRRKHKHKETEVNIGDRMALHEIPVTSCRGEPESSTEENKNLCPKKDSSHPKQKRNKRKETAVNIGDSMMSSEIPVTANGEEPESTNEVNKNECTQKDSFQWQHKEHNDKKDLRWF
ncbi:NK-tumor recognition protein-like isoform X1 [Schistocerca serialis cubense]|uniref:NK-tumor recognition protein-like isoform X1 n=1 Tax=Schistocerca serialis cubense TaxID=2023355 RepID=UPI00214DF536|nr:NK-tumor recognition protein-like isoform X1 [Schistocerca serialis cubense]